jgi:HEAT repeat protein
MAKNTEQDAPVMADILEAMDSGDHVSIPMLYRLSDLTPVELGEFCSGWATIDNDRRRVIVRHLADITEENFHVDFSGVFEHCLEDISPEVRKASLDGLWDSDKVSLIRPIVDLMENDPDNEVRILAAATLGHYVLLGEWRQLSAGAVEPVVESLLKQIEDEQTDDAVKNAALESAAASGHPRIESLIYNAYDSAELQAQKSALFAMGRSAETRWINIIIDEMSSPILEMRLEAARAAGEIGDKSAIAEVIELTSDEDLEVRLVAVAALGRLGGDIARRFLEDIIADPSMEELHKVASDALEDVDWLGGVIDL